MLIIIIFIDAIFGVFPPANRASHLLYKIKPGLGTMSIRSLFLETQLLDEELAKLVRRLILDFLVHLVPLGYFDVHAVRQDLL